VKKLFKNQSYYFSLLYSLLYLIHKLAR